MSLYGCLTYKELFTLRFNNCKLQYVIDLQNYIGKVQEPSPTLFFKIVLELPAEHQESLVAELCDFGFEGFEQHEQLLTAWTKLPFKGTATLNTIRKFVEKSPLVVRIADEEVVADRNWNEEWERTITARDVGPFRIQPTWQQTPVPPDRLPLFIDPKMAFGTGYHETTRLVLHLLEQSVRGGEHILDVGTGTGILGIAALKLGAHRVLGVDTDPWSFENAAENAKINQVSDCFEVREGSLDQVEPGARFHGILANINRNILLELGPGLSGHLRPGGWIILSGILDLDEAVIRDHEVYKKLRLGARAQENEWIALLLESEEN